MSDHFNELLLQTLKEVGGRLERLERRLDHVIKEKAVKTDVNDVKTELKADVKGVKTDLKSDVNDLKTEINDLRDELRSQ